MKRLRLLVGTLALCAITAPAFATPITTTFTVTGSSGPLTGVVANGQFTFDSSSIVFGGTVNQAGLLTSLDFLWNGITFTAATANTGFLQFDGNGTLTDALFGTTCIAGTCGVFSGFNTWYFRPGANTPFMYGLPETAGLFNGTITLNTPLGPRAPAPAVPEPTSLVLLGTGVASAMAARRRKKQSA